MKRKIFSIFFALILACSLGMVMAVPAVAAQETYYVDATNGNDTHGDGTETWVDNDPSGWGVEDTGPWLTISHAISQVSDTDTDTIIVAAGTYYEAVTIDKQLTLLGAQYDVDPTVEEARLDELAESIIDAGGSSAVVTITADSVIVNGFTITNGGGVAPSHLRGGVYLSGTLVSGCTISNNKIVENLRDGIDSCSSGSGVNVFENNIISNNGYGGVYLGRNEGSDILRNNVISDNEDYGCTGQIGIQSDDNIVEGNTINGDSSYITCSWGAYGIMVMGSSVDIRENNILRGNIINRGESGPGFKYGIAIGFAKNTLIEDNTIHNNVVGAGVFQDADTTSLRGNDIQGNEYGLKVGSAYGDTIDTTIEENDILNNDVGITIVSDIAASTTHINQNNIVDNTDCGVLNEISTLVDATSNWWGTAVESEVQAMVSGNVDYLPWLGNSPITGTAPTITAAAHPWTWYTSDSIQDAIDAASDSDTINVAAGTYYETIDVTKNNLTIQSISGDPSDTIIDADGASHTVVSILSSNVIFSGFTITGAIGFVYADWSTQSISGVYMPEVEGCHLSNLIIDDIRRETAGWCNGILLMGSSGNTFESITISNIAGGADASTSTITGILFRSDPQDSDSSGNSFTDITIDTITLENPDPYSSVTGIMLWGVGNEDNTFDRTKITKLTAPVATSGIRTDYERNSFKSTEISFLTAQRAYGILLENAVSHTFVETTISNIAGGEGGTDSARGIYLLSWYGGDCHDNSFTSTDISGLTGYTAQGIYATGGAHDNSFIGGSISGTKYGVYISEDCHSNSIHYTNIVGNTEGAYSDTVTLDATDNWWGDDQGPEHTSNPRTTIGDIVSDNVIFLPWLGALDPGGQVCNAAQNEGTGEWYFTIQAAIGSAISGDTISVTAGTYNETVVIPTEDLTLEGAQVGVDPTEEGARIILAEESTVTGAVRIEASDIVVDGFRIEGTVYVDDSASAITDATISNNYITGASYGIRVGTASNNVISQLIIEYNAIIDNTNKGICFWKVDWQAGNLHDVTIRDNTISGSDGSGISSYGAGPYFVVDNIITGNQGNGISLKYDDGDIVTGNIVTGNADMGINMHQVTNCLVEDNTVSGHVNPGVVTTFWGELTAVGKGSGIYLHEFSTGNTIRFNDITDNNNGVLISSESGDLPSGNSITYNNIAGNFYSGVLNALVAPPSPVDATNNWWGTAIKSQIADLVSSNVNYSTWLDAAYPGGESTNLDVTSISLESGWNLISLPLIPEVPAIEMVLAGADAAVNKVAYYTGGPEGTWPSYNTTEPGTSDLNEMQDGKGYWIDTKTAGALTIRGYELCAPPPLAVPPSYNLVEGWNLIGFKSLSPIAVEAYLDELSDVMEAMYGYDAATGLYTMILAATDLVPGQGYWLAVSAEGTIYP